MAITIDYATKVISVPQGDCTLVSGTVYTMDTESVFRQSVMALLADENHIWMPDVYNHNTEYQVAGVTYARAIQIINGYTIQFTPDTQWSVVLQGSNNDLWDVLGGILVQNQVQVIPTNSAGLIVGGGSGSAADVWNHTLSTGNSADTELTKARKAAETARNLSA